MEDRAVVNRICTPPLPQQFEPMQDTEMNGQISVLDACPEEQNLMYQKLHIYN